MTTMILLRVQLAVRKARKIRRTSSLSRLRLSLPLLSLWQLQRVKRRLVRRRPPLRLPLPLLRPQLLQLSHHRQLSPSATMTSLWLTLRTSSRMTDSSLLWISLSPWVWASPLWLKNYQKDMISRTKNNFVSLGNPTSKDSAGLAQFPILMVTLRMPVWLRATCRTAHGATRDVTLWWENAADTWLHLKWAVHKWKHARMKNRPTSPDHQISVVQMATTHASRHAVPAAVTHAPIQTAIWLSWMKPSGTQLAMTTRHTHNKKTNQVQIVNSNWICLKNGSALLF